MTVVLDFINKKSKEKKMYDYISPISLDSISKKKIKLLNRLYHSDEDWEKHKLRIVKQWIQMQGNFDTKLQVIVKKYLNKLQIKSDKEIEELMFALERREFTTRRILKQIDIPFNNLKEYKNKHAVWHFRGVKLYDDSDRWMNLIVDSNLYLLKDELVFWSRDEEKILFRIMIDKLRKINKLDYGVRIELNKKKYILRYKDNEVLFIVFTRNFGKLLKNEPMNLTREFVLKQEISKELKMKIK